MHTELPPKRDQEHKIIVKEGVPPINARPYRFPTSQKNEIEKMIQEILDTSH